VLHRRKIGPELASSDAVKAAESNHQSGTRAGDFYQATLAPLNLRDEKPFGTTDALLLIVLFVEIAVVMRLILAT
jgi:hypothetical protein